MDAYSPALIIATFSLVVLTAYYAIQTKHTVNVLRKTVELSAQPHIKGVLQPLGPVAFDLLIKNTGNGPANNIKLSYWIEECEQTKRNWTKQLMMPNDSDEFFIPINENDNKLEMDYFKNNQATIKIVGQCYDIMGKEHEINDSIDVTSYVRQFETTSVRYMEPTDEKIQKHLDEISNSTKSIADNFVKLKGFFEKKD